MADSTDRPILTPMRQREIENIEKAIVRMGAAFDRVTAERDTALREVAATQAALAEARASIRECIPDLEHYVSTHGPGPDKRLEALRVFV